MIRRYEALMLAVPELTKDETTNLEKGFDAVVRGAKGSVISFELWGKYRLAFPVRKNDYGIYFLARFEAEDTSPALESLKTFFTIKVNNIVMRNVLTRLAPDASLAYQRPKSLEEAASSRDVDTFLKENKMEGLMPSSASEEATTEAGDEEKPAATEAGDVPSGEVTEVEDIELIAADDSDEDTNEKEGA